MRDVVRRLERDGWRLARTGGDHRQYTHPTKPGTVTVAGGMSEDVPTGTWLNHPTASRVQEAMKKRYAVVYEWSGRNYGAHAPDVPGCIATGKTLEEVAERFREALAFHFEGMALTGEVIPEPTTLVGYAEVELPAPAVAAG